MGRRLVSFSSNSVFNSMAKSIITSLNDTISFVEQKKEDKSFQFSVCSFNVWCPYWNGDEHKHPQVWKERHNGILKILCDDDEEKNENELLPMNCDIYCIQEFWCDSGPFVRLYDNYLKARGYELHFFKRQMKKKPDGIAVAFKKDTFTLKNKSECKFVINNRVTLMMELEHKTSGCCMNIGATHLTFPQDDYDIKHVRPQMGKELLALMDKHTSNSAAIQMLCGDFNCNINGNEAQMCLKNGYLSSFHNANQDLKGNIVSHLNHDKEEVSADHIFYKRNPKLKGDSFAIETIDSYLYPRNLKVDKWPEEWTLSDHRPLVSTFELTTTK